MAKRLASQCQPKSLTFYFLYLLEILVPLIPKGSVKTLHYFRKSTSVCILFISLVLRIGLKPLIYMQGRSFPADLYPGPQFPFLIAPLVPLRVTTCYPLVAYGMIFQHVTGHLLTWVAWFYFICLC